MQTEQITYRPQYGADSYVKDSNVRFSDNLTIYQTSYNSIFFSSYNFKAGYLFDQMSAVVILGFVKDAKHHVDVQGFNVYHKNRLIKVSFYLNGLPIRMLLFSNLFFYQPFWRIWNATGSDGRGVIGMYQYLS